MNRPATFDPLTDPSLTASYRQPRSAIELCNEKHYHHMRAVRQDKWLGDLLARADKMKAEQEAALEEELKRPLEALGKRTRQRNPRR